MWALLLHFNETEGFHYFWLERLGSSEEQMCEELEQLKENDWEKLGDEAIISTDVLFRAAVKHFTGQRDFMKAIDVAESWNEWLFKIGVLSRQPKKVHVEIKDPYLEEETALEEQKEEHGQRHKENGNDAAKPPEDIDVGSISQTPGEEW